MININAIRITIAPKAMPMVHASDTLVLSALIIAPIPITGANMPSLRVITVAICICCMSLVDLVISEAVEKSSISSFAKYITFRNTAFLISLADLAAVFEAKRLTPVAHKTIAADIPIISMPIL